MKKHDWGYGVRQTEHGPLGNKLEEVEIGVGKDKRILGKFQNRRVPHFSELIIEFVRVTGYNIKIQYQQVTHTPAITVNCKVTFAKVFIHNTNR